MAMLTRIRPWRLRRVFLGRSSVGPLELKRLLSVLRLDAIEFEQSVFADAAVGQLLLEAEGLEIDRRIREHL
ncbi:hypothetical protein PlfCFBP13513_14975 [Plantibacter flavus]|nr:hypothetical protein PlfCFBP13513_14975 [Plantibacter flavus]